MQDFVRALAGFSPQGAAYWRARRRWSMWGSGVGVYILLTSVGVAALYLWISWQAGVWGFVFFVGSVPIIQQISSWPAGMIFFREAMTLRRGYDVAMRVRAAAQSDTTLGDTVSVSELSTPAKTGSLVEEDQVHSQPQSFGPFTSIATGDSVRLVWYGTLCAVLGPILCALGIALLILAPSRSFADFSMLLAFSVLGAYALLGPVALTYGLVALAWARRARKPLWFEADDIGLRPQGATPADPAAIGWGEARVFVRVSVPSALRRIRWTFYALDTGDRMLTWQVAHDADGTTQKASERFCQVIISHTRLPLRDITPLVVTLMKWPPLSAADLAHARSASQRAWASLVPPQVHIMRVLTILVIAFFAWIGVFYAAGEWALPQTQSAIYQRLATRIHAEQPLYHSSLATDDGGWLDNPSNTPNTSTPNTLSYPGAYTFRAGSYQLQTSSYDFLESLRNQAYGDVAVEVTMRMPDDRTPFDGAGLLLHQGSGGFMDTHQVAFTISGDGAWSANNFNLQGGSDTYATGDQHSSAIHTNAGALNTLLVLIRGHQFLFFVNNTYVGAYYDALSHPGYVGLFDNDSNTTVSFTNFTIYPAIETGW